MTNSTKQIKKILIANRGEIACRVIKTASKMSIATVAVYSDADRKALHVRLADEAVHIGPSPAVESYLVIEKIITAAIETGADAVHPGYGFLSENPAFMRACEAAGLIFIGPSAEAMEAMGLKDAAKKLMDTAGVPITPGYHGKDQSPKLLRAKAGMIGYPILIKAVAGGGGKGMRKVEADADFDAALASCQREAASSFGNQDVLIEKYIQSPRHIEVQVFGDTHGNVVHMFERDCSLQRRHQKVIEEAPAPGMTDAVRKAMTDAAIKAAQAVDYVGAGTVEFIVDGSGKLKRDGFWFMEMNTRLQVEHPVTEMVTGLDLVEWQIRVARGERLPAQKDIKMEGHAVEARLYAEDPANDFLPSVGKLKELCLSTYADDGNTNRIDTGVEEGDTISVFYDPMISKLISHAPNRSKAIEELMDALDYAKVIGIRSNLDFLLNLVSHKKFKQFKIDTGFIGANISKLSPEDLSSHPKAYALAAIAILNDGAGRERRLLRYAGKSISPWQGRDGWRLNHRPNFSESFSDDGEIIDVKIVRISENGYMAEVNKVPYILSNGYVDDPLNSPIETLLNFVGLWNDTVSEDEVLLRGAGRTLRISRLNSSFGENALGGNAITAPMPGKIIALNVAVGDSVSEGDALVVMEAMKMEQTLTAPRDGVVAEVGAELGELVTDGTLLVQLEEETK